MANLSETYVKSLKWSGKDQRISDGQGLYLNLRKTSKTWIIRKSFRGQNQIITLGKWPALSCRAARLEAARLIMETDISSATVETLVDKYVKEVVRVEHKRPHFSEAYFNNGVIPFIGNKKIRDIRRTDLVGLVQAYVKRGPRAADQLRSNLKRLFGYGVELGYLDINPMNEVTRRVTQYKAIPRERVLTDEEIRMVWEWDHKNASLIRFLMLSSLRISEALNGHQDADRWIVPEAISKNGKPHWIHLTKTAAGQLPLPRCTATNVQHWLKRRLLKLGYSDSDRFTPHDLRRTAAFVIFWHGPSWG